MVNLYNEGTRARWFWECLDCAEYFEPTYERLSYNRDLDPGEAGIRRIWFARIAAV
ncbi:phage terminase large subunit family protein [Paracoccus cavernae]|uniref:phage terminase large subunit family protein n=1 Tax=Paracoccus cavernae TaxID=1571207 RepID=UPI0036310E64